MTKFFTSDLHFYHKKICEYTNRGLFTNQQKHEQWLLDIISLQVKPGDTIYHLGDFAFTSDHGLIEAILSNFGCQVVAIKGNHDSRKTWGRVKSNRLISFKDYDEIKLKNGKEACLFHFPITVWHKQHYGSYMLHGHSHGSFQGQGKCLDVGLDSAYNILGSHRMFTEDDIVEFMENREMVVSDHHKQRSSE